MKRQSTQRGALRLLNGTWSLRWRAEATAPGGHRPTRSFRVGPASRFRTKPAARIEADRLLERMGLGINVAGRVVGFRDFADQYKVAVLSTMAASSRMTSGSILRAHLVKHFADTPLHEIAGPAAARYIAAAHAKGLQRGTLRAHVNLLGRMLDCALNMGYAAAPLNRRAFRLPTANKPPEPRCFSPEEANRIVEGSEFPWRALYAALAFTGLRCSEALALEWHHVDLGRRMLHIRQAANYGTLKDVKSRNSRSDLPMSERLVEILTAYRDHLAALAPGQPLTGLLFPSPRGGPYWSSSVRVGHFGLLLKRLGIASAGLHAFRHGFATVLFAAGASAPTVRSLLRHGSIEITMRYSHVTSEDQKRAAAAAGNAIMGSTTP